MKCKVRLNKNQLNYFRFKARNSKLEIQAYLIGKVISPELVVVERFVYPKEYATQTTEEVQWWLDDYNLLKQSAEKENLRIIGDIHSHPSWDAVMSFQDYQAHIEDGHRICGLCSVNNKKTRVRFWIAESSLPCEIVYE